MTGLRIPAWLLAVLAGALPVLAANLAFLVNIQAGLEGCFPYWDGCMSVSRGVRTGPGLWLFKVLALPGAIAMALCWRQVGRWLGVHVQDPGDTRRNIRTIVWLGLIGACFSLVYAAALGTEGELYKWMRRYGVVFYFGLTGLAQLWLLSVVWKRRREIVGGRLIHYVSGYAGVVGLTWALGVASALKRKLIDDPDFLDRVENALEWDFALALSMAFVAMAPLLRTAKIRDGTSSRRQSNKHS